jgi:7-cyano-7-deazaguanine synthase
VERSLAKQPAAVVLLSGGLDSATCAAIAQDEGFDVHALSFRYGQRHGVEIDCAKQVAIALGIADHRIVDIDLRLFGGSALTDDCDVPKGGVTDVIPITYVPARNTIFLSLALALAEVISARDIFIGVNAVDYSGYPDCRPEYIAAFQRMSDLATKGGVEGNGPKIRTPLADMTKADIIKLGTSLSVDFSLTSSCYDPKPTPCGECDSCRLRAKGFQEAGMPDPLL